MYGKLTLALIAFTFTTISFFWASPAEANSVRCGHHIVSSGGRTGPTMYEVLKKCGEPKERAGLTWIYELGGRTRFLTFDSGGLLVNIRSN